jgi:hypothetical protein
MRSSGKYQPFDGWRTRSGWPYYGLATRPGSLTEGCGPCSSVFSLESDEPQVPAIASA